mmetsp:Transcript_48504/g.103196  ORF Transcript_48504/g.103196 Transcript_48504/m.103196 type:complete len:319 (+) Transcript_48504:854-1810(+)
MPLSIFCLLLPLPRALSLAISILSRIFLRGILSLLFGLSAGVSSRQSPRPSSSSSSSPSTILKRAFLRGILVSYFLFLTGVSSRLSSSSSSPIFSQFLLSPLLPSPAGEFSRHPSITSSSASDIMGDQFPALLSDSLTSSLSIFCLPMGVSSRSSLRRSFPCLLSSSLSPLTPSLILACSFFRGISLSSLRLPAGAPLRSSSDCIPFRRGICPAHFFLPAEESSISSSCSSSSLFLLFGSVSLFFWLTGVSARPSSSSSCFPSSSACSGDQSAALDSPSESLSFALSLLLFFLLSLLSLCGSSPLCLSPFKEYLSFLA